MNCKPGDMAVIIASGHSGKMVTCVRLLTAGDAFPTADGPAVGKIVGPEPIWLIDRWLEWWNADQNHAFEAPICPDSILMPIRPGAADQPIEADLPVEVVV